MRQHTVIIAVCLALVTLGYVVYTQYAAGLYYLAGQYDRMMNPYGIDADAPEPDATDRALHADMFVADLHIDTLKWERDLLERSVFGHADVPRLDEGNVALQVFTIVTRSPINWPWMDCVSGRSPDTNTALFFMQGRPAGPLRERAMYQINRFKDAAERSRAGPGPELRLIETAADLEHLVADRAAGKAVIGGIIGIEGGHWIGGPGWDSAAVRREMAALHDAGVRLFAPVHRFDNHLAGSNEGCERHGLTQHGHDAIGAAQELGMVVDLAHISGAALRDATAYLDDPVTVSHTGVRAGCEAPCRPDRNLSDDDIRHLIDADGVIGIGFWPQAIGPSVWRVQAAMQHITAIAEDMGVAEPTRHVAIGSDYDGSVTPMIEVTHLDVLTTLLRRGPQPFSEQQVRGIMGANTCRLFATVLPGGDGALAADLCDPLAEPMPAD
ncbi:peptidase M19 [Aquisalimonas sp. 2447]|uniref:dipeptidase n=1 Tax=Aquisalimonas sp. 2447 TaxID=2740807 RepID=UPI001432504C|nr:membrane dipeptidase [Aquisalimonas sp. 2447]QIT56064.1 peptidase M19 [Aquisalimonas sp. 2447]